MEASSRSASSIRLGLAFAIIRSKPATMDAKQYAQNLHRKLIETAWSSRSNLKHEIERLKYELATERVRSQSDASVAPTYLTPPSSSETTSMSRVVVPNHRTAGLLEAVLCLNASRRDDELPVDQTTVIRTTNAVQVLAEHVQSTLLSCKKQNDDELAVQKLVLDTLMTAQPRSWAFVELTQKSFLEMLVRQFVLENDGCDSRERCLQMLLHFASEHSALRLPLEEILLDTLVEVAAELNQVCHGQQTLNGLCWRNSVLLIVLLNRMNCPISGSGLSSSMAAQWNRVLNQCFTNLNEQFPLFVAALSQLVPADFARI